MENGSESKIIDSHVHTNASDRGQWWHSIGYNQEEAVKQAKTVGLDGLAITDHNTIKGIDSALNAAEKHGLIVVPGIEISARDQLIPHPRHIIALGINPEITKESTIPKNQTIEHVIKWIHDQGALAIAAHPQYPEISTKKQAPFSLNQKQLIQYSDKLDGVETLTLIGHNQPISRWSEINNIPQLGGSDAHHLKQIGLVKTEIFGQIKNWQDIIQAIKNNQTKPFTDVSTEVLGQNSYKDLVFKPGFQKKFPTLSRIFY